MNPRTIKFKESFDLTINKFLRLTAPSPDLFDETSLEYEEKNVEESEIKESQDISSPKSTLLDLACASHLNFTPEMKEENQKAEREKIEFKLFFRDVKELQRMVLAGYAEAELSRDNSTMDYLDYFSNEVAKVVKLVKKDNATLAEKKQAINNLIAAACPSSAIAKTIAPVVSPVVGLAGACIGLIGGGVIGAFSGALLGLGCGLALVVSAASNGTSMDINVVLGALAITGILGAIAGMVRGAFEGAQLGQNYVSSSVHSTLFKPTPIGSQMDKVVNATTLRKSLGKQLIEQEMKKSFCASTENVPQEIFTLIGEYAGDSDKEMAVARPK